MRNKIIALLSLIMIFSLFMTGKVIFDNYQQKEIKAFASSVFYENVNEDIVKEPDFSRFQTLFDVNSDFSGWVSIPNTKVDYPVVKGNDNEYYIDHDFRKNKNEDGSIFIDFRNKGDGTDRNMIIYGHHTKNGTMFTTLSNYKKPSFFENNPYIFLDTPYGNFTYEVFSAYVTDVNFEYNRTDFIYDQHFSTFLEEITTRSLHLAKEGTEETKKILTLSTCSYEFSNARFVVHGRLVAEDSENSKIYQ